MENSKFVGIDLVRLCLNDSNKQGVLVDKFKKNEDKGKSNLTHKLGDKVERVGEKLKNMGADKVGNAVYKAGNKMEHSKDNKK